MDPAVDDTENCPRGHCCESCGVQANELYVETFHVPLGVFCLTVCRRCGWPPDGRVTPPVTANTALRLIAQHCGHRGIDMDRMAALAREESR
jgi:hypothetical protein